MGNHSLTLIIINLHPKFVRLKAESLHNNITAKIKAAAIKVATDLLEMFFQFDKHFVIFQL